MFESNQNISIKIISWVTGGIYSLMVCMPLPVYAKKNKEILMDMREELSKTQKQLDEVAGQLELLRSGSSEQMAQLLGMLIQIQSVQDTKKLGIDEAKKAAEQIETTKDNISKEMQSIHKDLFEKLTPKYLKDNPGEAENLVRELNELKESTTKELNKKIASSRSSCIDTIGADPFNVNHLSTSCPAIDVEKILKQRSPSKYGQGFVLTPDQIQSSLISVMNGQEIMSPDILVQLPKECFSECAEDIEEIVRLAKDSNALKDLSKQVPSLMMNIGMSLLPSPWGFALIAAAFLMSSLNGGGDGEGEGKDPYSGNGNGNTAKGDCAPGTSGCDEPNNSKNSDNDLNGSGHTPTPSTAGSIAIDESRRPIVIFSKGVSSFSVDFSKVIMANQSEVYLGYPTSFISADITASEGDSSVEIHAKKINGHVGCALYLIRKSTDGLFEAERLNQAGTSVNCAVRQ